MERNRSGRTGRGDVVDTSKKSEAARFQILQRAAIETLESRTLLAAQFDFGDAPDTYSTLLASNGARHQGPSALFLGTRWDSEADGHPSSAANGDDTTPAGQPNDEDGVTLPSPTPGTTATVSVVASAAGKLDAFVDFNGDGDFGDPGEKIFDSVSVVAGNNTLHYDVPKLARSGKVFARFRVSSAGGLSYNGPAADGEVEDYQFTIKPLFDFGDAPDSYATTLASNGPRHALSPLFLGTRIDDEPDGQPSDDATGDDFAPLGQPNDEDGVNMPALVVGQDVTISVVSSGKGKLDAWIDFDGKGYFDSYYDEVLVDAPVVAGNNQFTISIPQYVGAQTSFARFRLSSAGGLSPTGPAPDGEVEDYQVNFDFGEDFGDAPDSYHTLLASDGPRHKLGSGLHLGYAVDAEPDGQPTADATGDDNNGQSDEDGVYLPDLAQGQDESVSVQSSGDGFVDGWVDFNHNGTFDSNEKVMDSVPVSYFGNNLSITVPADATLGATFARFRLSSAGGLGPTGEAPDGEVEDYQVNIIAPVDYGDAPDSYGTLAASGGPSHALGSGLFLGDGVDAEADGLPTDDASGDDNTNIDDEDGVSVPGDFVPGEDTTVQVYASGDGKLDAFMDFNGDGDFNDPGEKVFDSVPVTTGENDLTISVPADSINGNYTFARFRISSAGNLGPGGPAPDGEVEDYRFYVDALPADLTMTKNDAPKTVKPGDNITYTITVNNLGPGDANSAELADSIPDNMSFVSASGPSGWSPFLPDVGDTFGTVYFDRDTYAATDGPATFTVTFKVDPATPINTQLANSPNIREFDSDDPDFTNNSLEADTTVVKSTPSSGATVSVVTDPADSSKKALKIVGTGSAETIEVLQSGSSQGKAVVKFNGKSKGTFSFSGHIVVYGGGGNDTITIDTAITRGAFIFGEGGNDVINAGNGADVVIGGSGNDKLFGRGGRDLLFGGDGADSLDGGDADDILLAGKSNFDTDIPSLVKLQKEWTRTDKNYTTRVNDIKNGGGLNGSVKLAKTTADSTIASVDSLKGNAGSDLFLANLVASSGKPKDLLQDKSASETSVDLD